MSLNLTGSDFFAGCGGSGQGMDEAMREAGGGEIVEASNHWKLAMETYGTNFKNTRVIQTDLSLSDPRRHTKTTIATFSPECTTHTPAGGNTHKKLKAQIDMFNKNIIDPATERSRQTMWDVVRFAEYHKYEIVIVENVIEAKTTWPLFEAWLNAMHVIGYMHKVVYANSMHYDVPQSRDRMFVVFWKKGNPKPYLEHMPEAWCVKCQQNVNSIQSWKNSQRKYGKYKQQYVYRCSKCTTEVEPYYYAAFNIIDWSDKGTRIGDREANGLNTLADNTIRRIQWGIDNLANPFIVDDKQSTGVNFRVRSVNQTTNTIHTDPRLKLVMPFMIKMENTSRDKIRSLANVAYAQTCTDSTAVVNLPFIVEAKGTGKARRITDTLSCATTIEYHSLLTPEKFNAFLAYNNNGVQVSHITDVTGTQATKERMSLIQDVKPRIEDCYYRMLKPSEIKGAMAFRDDYVILGSKKDQVKQLGNAVTPPVMKWLVKQCIDSLR